MIIFYRSNVPLWKNAIHFHDKTISIKLQGSTLRSISQNFIYLSVSTKIDLHLQKLKESFHSFNKPKGNMYLNKKRNHVNINSIFWGRRKWNQFLALLDQIICSLIMKNQGSRPWRTKIFTSAVGDDIVWIANQFFIPKMTFFKGFSSPCSTFIIWNFHRDYNHGGNLNKIQISEILNACFFLSYIYVTEKKQAFHISEKHWIFVKFRKKEPRTGQSGTRRRDGKAQSTATLPSCCFKKCLCARNIRKRKNSG